MDSVWPPEIVKLADWDNGAGVAVVCQGKQHRVVRRDGRVIALDHPDIETRAAAAEVALARGEFRRLGFRYRYNSFNRDAMNEGRQDRRSHWAPLVPAAGRLHPGEIADPNGLAPCVRLCVEAFAPCSWCGRLLAQGSTCTADDDPFCVLANGNGWRKSIGPGWVRSTLVGIPTGLTKAWPNIYRWWRNGPTEHIGVWFVASPWWPDLHPRRFAKLICDERSERGGTYSNATQVVIGRLHDELGEMKPSPPRVGDGRKEDARSSGVTTATVELVRPMRCSTDGD